jgi:trk system potassium uptake protein TrkH
MNIKKLRSLTSMQYISLGFALLIAVGTALLMLPLSLTSHKSISFIDALFTATSAVSTTGLVVVDTGSFFSPLGQWVILILMQIGGLGYMIFIGLFLAGMKKRLSVGGVELLHESIGRPSSEDLFKFSKKVIIFTIFFESLGVLLFTCYLVRFFPLSQALYSSLFHSVSAFCTAGFGLYSDSLMSHRDSIFFNVSVMFVCIAGSIGFFVLNDIYHFCKQIVLGKYPRGFSAHTKFATAVTFLIVVIGIVIVYFWGGQVVGETIRQRIIYSTFQVVSASTTAGFNSIDIGKMSDVALWVLAVLMFIGFCPGGTGGGIKTTTFGLVALSIFSLLKGKDGVNVFDRRVSQDSIMRAYAIFIIVLIWVALALTVMVISEKGMSFPAILLEICSAVGTTGLSTGITPALSVTGKTVIMLMMFLGRVGPIAIGYSLVGRPRPARCVYAKAQILVG